MVAQVLDEDVSESILVGCSRESADGASTVAPAQSVGPVADGHTGWAGLAHLLLDVQRAP